MKTKYLYQLSAFLLGIIVMFGCAKFEDFESLDLDPAPIVSLTLVSAADSTISVDVTSSMSGYVAAILLTGTGNEVPDSSALLQQNVLYDEYKFLEAVANETISFTYASVVQDAEYEVMAVAVNEDGMVSDVSVLAVSSTDSYGPQLVSTTPEITYGYALDPDVALVLTFDEAVILGSGDFSYEVPWSGIPIVDIPAENVSVDGVNVFITIPDGYIHGDYFWLHYEEGAVVDAAGNETEALSTYYDGDLNAFIGVYWSVVPIYMEPVSITPDVAVAQAADFDIVLTFSDYVSAVGDTIYSGDITLTYDDGAGMVTQVDVPSEDVVIAGTTVTISQTVFSPGGGTVTVDIPEDIMTVYYDNPIVAITETWDIAMPGK